MTQCVSLLDEERCSNDASVRFSHGCHRCDTICISLVCEYCYLLVTQAVACSGWRCAQCGYATHKVSEPVRL